MFTFVVFIIVLGFLVLIHELGHFVTARRNGIKADEFGFGFPPRAVGVYFDEKKKGWRFVLGSRHVETENTVYSLNWLPIGGFVKIKGEDGSAKNEANSFASKSAWVRTKVLLAGVTMNVVFAWLLLSLGLMLGVPQAIDDAKANDSRILISTIAKDSAASAMGLQMGDVILSEQIGFDGVAQKLVTVKDTQDFIAKHQDREIELRILRGQEAINLGGHPKMGSEGRAVLGISLAQVRDVRFGLFGGLGQGAIELKNMLLMVFAVLGNLLLGKNQGVDVTGFVGIAVMTGQVIPLGIAYLLRFVAVLSLNLAIVNALPIPALDGGRVLFILIEKIKGSPVSQKLENIFHTVGFALLILLMVFVTYKDFVNFDIFGKVGQWF